MCAIETARKKVFESELKLVVRFELNKFCDTRSDFTSSCKPRRTTNAEDDGGGSG